MESSGKIGYFLTTYTFKGESKDNLDILLDSLKDIQFKKMEDQSTYFRTTSILNTADFIKSFREKIGKIQLDKKKHINGYYSEYDGRQTKLYEVIF